MTPVTVSTHIKTPQQLFQHLKCATKTTIVKLGASWCQPCKQIEPVFFRWVEHCRDLFHWVVVDIDESYELYGFLKGKRTIHGIPAFLVYYVKPSSEITYVPDDLLVGANRGELEELFVRASNRSL